MYPYVFRSWQRGGIRWPGYPRTVAGLSRRSGDLHRRSAPGKSGSGSSSPIWPARWSQVGRDGLDVFYQGQIAEAIARDFEANGGYIRKRDLEEYEPAFHTPVRGGYRDVPDR